MKVLLLFLIPSFSFALSEKDVVESVLENFLLVEEAVMKYEAAKGEVMATEGAFDHKLTIKSRNKIEDKYDNSYLETSLERITPYKGLSLIAGHRQGRGNFPAYDGKYETSGAGEIFAGLSIPLLRNFSTDENRSNLEISKIEKDQANEQVRVKKNIYVHKALSLYYKWLLELRKIEIKKEILKLAEDRNQMIEKRFKAGAIEKLKLNDNQRSVDKRRDDVVKSEIDEFRYRSELSLYLRNKDSVPQNLHESPLTENLIERSKKIPSPGQHVPQLNVVKLERKKLEVLERLYKQQRMPGLNLELLGSRELSGNEAYDPQALQVGVKFDFPLENRKARGKSVGQEYKIKAIEKQQEYIDRELKRFYDFSISAMNDSKRRWEIVGREYQNTVKMAQAEKIRWEQGASDLFIVSLREQDVADTDIRRWTALYEYLQYQLNARLYSADFVAQ